MTEKKLIAGLRNGDMSAYEQAFHSYYPRFVHLAEGIVKDIAIAKDLVQNVFVKVWYSRSKLQEDLSLNNYLFVLTKREVLNYLRSHNRFEDLSSLNATMQDDVQDAELKVDAMLIRDQISLLPEQRRKVFELSRLQGVPNKEIAKILGISEKTVERHITLANKELRNLFKEY